VIEALVTLNDSVPVSKFITAINSSSALRDVMASPGLKTLLAPSDESVGEFTLTDDILLGLIFDGNLTADALLALCEIAGTITAKSGEKYNVTCTQTPTSARGRRATVIHVGNSRTTTRLTVLNVPSNDGTVHGCDSVLLPASDGNNNNNKNGESSAWYDEAGALAWVLFFAAAVVLFIIILAIVVSVQRSRHDAKARPGATVVNDGFNRSGGPGDVWRHSQHRASRRSASQDDDFVVVDNALAELARTNSVGRPKHYYPSGNPQGDTDAMYSASQVNQPTHFYPQGHQGLYAAPTEVGRNQSGRTKSQKLATPLPPDWAAHRMGSTRMQPHGYVDPVPPPRSW
jgi:hypothetical protein